MMSTAQVAAAPAQPKKNVYSIGYQDGMSYGQKLGNRNYIVLGVTIGLVFAAVIVVAVLAVQGLAR